MNHQLFGRLAGGGAIALIAVLIGACGSDPVEPVPGQTGGTPSASHSAPTPSTTTPAKPPTSPTKPTKPATNPTKRPQSPKPTPACLGAVIYTISGDAGEPYPKSLCMKVGGVLRIEHVAAGTVSADPAGSTSMEYEAAVIDCRFIRTGTVTVHVALETGTRSITVVVVS